MNCVCRWDDARVHWAHGLRYGTGVFDGNRCYDTPEGPAVFRLTYHCSAARLSQAAGVSSRTRSKSCARDVRAAPVRAAGVHSAVLLRLQELGVLGAGHPIDRRSYLALGTSLGDDAVEHAPRQYLELAADSRQRRPARTPKATVHLPDLDARGDRGPERRYYERHAHARRHRRRRPGATILHGQRARLHARPVDWDPARITRATRSSVATTSDTCSRRRSSAPTCTRRRCVMLGRRRGDAVRSVDDTKSASAPSRASFSALLDTVRGVQRALVAMARDRAERGLARSMSRPTEGWPEGSSLDGGDRN